MKNKKSGRSKANVFLATVDSHIQAIEDHVYQFSDLCLGIPAVIVLEDDVGRA